MQKKIYDYMKRHHMASAGMKILVGFSGGADSTALLQLLWEYAQAHGIEVRALHVNHGIRGEEAQRDQTFCEQFCEARGIPLTVTRADVPGMAREKSVGLEEAGRLVRYEAFAKEAAESGIDRIALAHHQNDQAETMLFHLMRGTGLRGLRGMAPVRTPYIRPLLCVTREEIRNWLLKREIVWMEDSTNQDTAYTRNRIRSQVLAALEQIRPGSAARMADTAGRLLELEDFLEAELQKHLAQSVRRREDGFSIPLEAYRGMHPAMQKQVALWCMEQLFGARRNPEAVHAEQVRALTEGRRGSRITLPDGCFAVLGYEELLLKKGYGAERSEEEVTCEPGCEYRYRESVFCLTLEKYEKFGEIPANRYTKLFDYDKIKNHVVLRTRKPGDYLELSGGVHKKLKAYLIDCKVPREERDRLILLADGSHILWVTGMRVSEGCKVTETTKNILRVTLQPPASQVTERD